MGNLLIGQGQLVTLLQMASAYVVIVNGGILCAPHIIRQVGSEPQPQPSGRRVISSALTVSGSVPGIDAPTFAEIAEVAKNACPISNAIKGNVALSVEATLES